jgi:hypothetical protein
MKINLELTYEKEEVRVLVESALKAIPTPCEGRWETRDYYGAVKCKFVPKAEEEPEAEAERQAAVVSEEPL